MNNIPKVKIGIVAVSRDCFPESLSTGRRQEVVKAYGRKYDKEDIYECPICIVESEIDMVKALEDIKKSRVQRPLRLSWELWPGDCRDAFGQAF